MNKRNIFRESLWICACLIASVIITLQLTGFTADITATIDVNIHDTYIVFNVYDILIFVFAIIVSLVFAVRSIIKVFRSFYFILVEVLGFALSLQMLILFYDIVGRFRTPVAPGGGWTIYPPSIAAESIKSKEPELTYLQILIVSYCLLIAATVLAAVFFLIFRSTRKVKR